MAKQANRKMIGGFVILAVAILAVSVVIFGSGGLFRETTEYVLYFEGSVKGLNVGSPVLHGGVQVGAVKKIIIRSYLDDLKTDIPVFVEIYPDSFEIESGELELKKWRERIPELIKRGLRAQLVPQSLITGQLAIEVGMHPDTPVVLKNIDKDLNEIPTIPSALERLGKFMDQFDLTQINTRLVSILDSADRLLRSKDIGAGLHELKGVLQDTRSLVQNVSDKIDPLAENLNNSLTDARELVNNADQEVKLLSGKAQSTLDDIGKLARDMDAQMVPLSKSVTEALESVRSASKSIDGLVGKRSPTRADLDNTLMELAGAARSLRVLADFLEQHPDALIKGKTGY